MKILYNLQLEVYIYNKTVRIMIYYEKNKNINIIAKPQQHETTVLTHSKRNDNALSIIDDISC